MVGATGNVGREMIKILEQRKFPVREIHFLASERSAGERIEFNGHEHVVQNLDEFDFEGVQIGLFSPGASVSKIHAPRAASAGVIVIDNTSYFRMDPDVPLVVPEVNPDAIAEHTKKGIIANPNCSTIQMVHALVPIHQIATIKRIVVSTYQAVSGAGKAAMDELFEQTRSRYMTGEDVPPNKFSKPIAFNVIPQIDVFLENGYTKEEMKMVNETKKILDPNIAVTATCVRVPVFNGHAESVTIETEKPITPEMAREALSKAPGIKVVDDPSAMEFITPAECSGEDPTYVSRIRADESVTHGLNMWVVADNLRKGAALNTIQIAEKLIEQGHIK
ncbi:putative aspartate semialdehyde dehydrogenase [Magnetofaba australis IT-1]|uniref:Aspartate-semialdehyde dehydrogenase n=1 Tax=Magnetofaba australis IT-1 TaxID=1434232 RepID=A0A1Y2K6D1_9PROT|nr:putative aspartate semialdehyde dehydrogenase [Magnetofaba australis IT-1]